MVLVLSAVVVAGVMVYYQTAQTNNELEKTSAEIMHIVSEVNGLYAGATNNGGGIYAGFDNDTLLNSIPDLNLKQFSNGGSTGTEVIKTALPDIYLTAQALNYDPATKNADSSGALNYFMIELVAEKSNDIAKLCQKIVSLNYGGELAAFVFLDPVHDAKVVDISEPLSNRLGLCQRFSGAAEDAVALVFK